MEDADLKLDPKSWGIKSGVGELRQGTPQVEGRGKIKAHLRNVSHPVSL
jgi:hypothetical protein